LTRLKDHVAGNLTAPVTIPDLSGRPIQRQFLFPGLDWPSQRAPFSLEAFRGVWNTAAARAGLPRIVPHDLRHTYASRCLAARVDIQELQRLLGHSTAAL